jgi:hypothetical protein
MVIHHEAVTYAMAVVNFAAIYYICNEKKIGAYLWVVSLIYLIADMGIHKHYPVMGLFLAYLALTFYVMLNKIK